MKIKTAKKESKKQTKGMTARVARKEFEAKAKEIMDRVKDNGDTIITDKKVIELTKKIYRLKLKYFKYMTMRQIKNGDYIMAEYCPLCEFKDGDCGKCQLWDTEEDDEDVVCCCREWDDMESSLRPGGKDNRWFLKNLKAMAVKIEKLDVQ